MPSSSPWYRGMAQHLLFWAVAASFFLFDRPDTSVRTPLSFVLGITCIAGLAAGVSADARRPWLRSVYLLAAASVVLAVLALHGAYLRSIGGLTAQSIEAVLQTDVAEAYGYS